MSEIYLDIPERLNDSKVLSGWQVCEQIGAGGAGHVYRIKSLSDDSEAAVKWIHIENRGNRQDGSFLDSLSRTTNEISSVLKLKDVKQIARIDEYEIIQDETSKSFDVLIRMKLMVPLTEWMKKGRRTVNDVLEVLTDICAAVDECHKNGILHRDIKPDNILHASDGFKLSDFGVAGMAENQDGLRTYTRSFAAPEYKPGGHMDKKSDIYSLGLTAYLLFNNNRMPYQKGHTKADREKAWQMKSEAVSRGQKFYPAPEYTADDKVAEVLVKACAIDINERYESAGEFCRELISAVDKAGGFRNTVLPFGDANAEAPAAGDPLSTNTASHVTKSILGESILGTPAKTAPKEPSRASSGGGVVVKFGLEPNDKVENKPDDPPETVNEPPKKQRKKGRTALVILVSALIVAAAVFAAWYFVNMGKNAPSADYSVKAGAVSAIIASEVPDDVFTWYPSGNANMTSSSAAVNGECVIEPLIPDTEYVIISAGGKEKTFLTASSAIVPAAARKASLAVYACDWARMDNIDTSKLGSAFYPEVTSVGFDGKTVLSPDRYYFAVFTVEWNGALDGELITDGLLVLRADDGSIFTSPVLFDEKFGKEPYGGVLLKELQGLMEEACASGAMGPDVGASLNLYMGKYRLSGLTLEASAGK